MRATCPLSLRERAGVRVTPRPLPQRAETQQSSDSAVTPAKAGVQTERRRGAAPQPKNFPPITIEEIERYGYDSWHITGCKFARDQLTGGVYAVDELGPFEVDDDGAVYHISPDRIAGYGNAPWQTFDDSDLEEWRARKGAGIKLITGPWDVAPKASIPQLTPTERRIRERLDQYMHDPDPWGAPFDSANPGRSPPW